MCTKKNITNEETVAQSLVKSGRLILDRDSFFKCEGNHERARGVILRYLHIITIVVEELLINLTRNLKDEIVTF